jgi:hypothetical protein
LQRERKVEFAILPVQKLMIEKMGDGERREAKGRVSRRRE